MFGLMECRDRDFIVLCPACVMELVVEKFPPPGAFSVCVWCSRFVVFGEQRRLRIMSNEEFAAETEKDQQQALMLQRGLKYFNAGYLSH